MLERLRRVLPVVGGLALFLGALAVLRLELRNTSWHDLSADILTIPPSKLALAFALAILNYAALTGYDLLAFAYIRRSLPRAHIALASFVAYAISNNIGFAMLSGASVRYRFYARWGVTAEQLTRIVFSYSVTFWLGLFLLGGLSLALSPFPAAGLPMGAYLAPLGWALALVPPAYVLTTVLRKEPFRLRQFTLPLPSPAIAIGQVAISSIEWALAGAVLYVLLPDTLPPYPPYPPPLPYLPYLPFLPFLASFLVAILLGMASHVPGGVGVFEGLMVLLLKPSLSSGQLLPALVVYRAVYYIAPLAVALAVLLGDEVRQRRHQAARFNAVLGRLTAQLTPGVLSVFTFFAGLVLLFSGATPAATGRLELLDRFVPIGLIETSHFLGSIAGALLLVLSQGLARRLDAAYYLTAATMAVGIAASLLKGFDYEEAAILLVVLAVLWRARPAFDRRAAFFDTRYSPGWIAAVAGALGASAWLGLFAFKHVDYSNDLWWQFELTGEASRFLRASVGSALVLLLFAFARLIRHAPHDAPEPDEADFADAEKAIASQTATYPYLAYLRDKALLFNEARTAFVMYGVQGRTWVALGDPVGPEDQLNEAIRAFLERCADFGGIPVFYEIGKVHLHRYADFGLTFVKLGEEARVDLSAFGLAGGHSAKYRQVIRRLEKDGGTFRVVRPSDVAMILTELRAVSDDWLNAKANAEKGFSLGFFDERYLQQFPIAVVEHGGRIVAFANIWTGPGQVDLSIDLMRYHRDAPKNVMEALLVHLMVWGKEQGYRWFALGMAPLSGFEASPVAPLWTRLGAFLYAHGEPVYKFQGLRAYKEKFDPIWEPRYLAYPGGLRLPRILTDVSALIAGGYRRIFQK